MSGPAVLVLPILGNCFHPYNHNISSCVLIVFYIIKAEKNLLYFVFNQMLPNHFLIELTANIYSFPTVLRQVV